MEGFVNGCHGLSIVFVTLFRSIDRLKGYFNKVESAYNKVVCGMEQIIYGREFVIDTILKQQGN